MTTPTRTVNEAAFDALPKDVQAALLYYGLQCIEYGYYSAQMPAAVDASEVNKDNSRDGLVAAITKHVRSAPEVTDTTTGWGLATVHAVRGGPVEAGTLLIVYANGQRQFARHGDEVTWGDERRSQSTGLPHDLESK